MAVFLMQGAFIQLFASFGVPILLIIWMCALSGKKNKAAGRSVDDYMAAKRNSLLSLNFPEYTYHNNYNGLTDREKSILHKNYSLVLKSNFDSMELEAKHGIYELEERHYDDGTEYISHFYSNYIIISPRLYSGYSYKLPCSFRKSHYSMSLLRGAEAIADKIARLRHEEYVMEDYRRSNKRGETVLDAGGKLMYEDISTEQWNGFMQKGTLDNIEVLIDIWKEKAKVDINYSYREQTFCVIITEAKKYNSPIQCLMNDFLIDNAEAVKESMKLINIIAAALS